MIKPLNVGCHTLICTIVLPVLLLFNHLPSITAILVSCFSFFFSDALLLFKSSHYLYSLPEVKRLYPFVPESQFPAANKILEKELSKFPAFNLTLQELDFFQHSSSCTVFLKPDPEVSSRGLCSRFPKMPQGTERLKALFDVLQKCFPFCDDLAKLSGEGFHPHLTLGQWPNAVLPPSFLSFARTSLFCSCDNIPRTPERELLLLLAAVFYKRLRL